MRTWTGRAAGRFSYSAELFFGLLLVVGTAQAQPPGDAKDVKVHVRPPAPATVVGPTGSSVPVTSVMPV